MMFLNMGDYILTGQIAFIHQTCVQYVILRSLAKNKITTPFNVTIQDKFNWYLTQYDMKVY